MPIKTICLEKQGHAWIFRYQRGLEDDLLEETLRLADDPETPFDWTDAATVSLRLTEEAPQAETAETTAAPTALLTLRPQAEAPRGQEGRL